MTKTILPLIVLSMLFTACAESTTEPDDNGPLDKSRILFVNTLVETSPLQFQVQRNAGSGLASIVPGWISFSNLSAYLRVESGASRVRAMDSITRAIIFERDVTLAKDGAYSFFLYRRANGDTSSILLGDNLAQDSAGRVQVRPINLLGATDSLRFTFINVDTVTSNAIAFSGEVETFTPIFDSTSSPTIRLEVDILESNGSIDQLFVGDVTLGHRGIFSLAAIGTRGNAQIIVIPHLQL